MASERKFYRTVFTVTVLSEEEPAPVDLRTLNYQITDGDWSGVLKKQRSLKISGKRMAQLLIKQGSSPEFFNLTDEG